MKKCMRVLPFDTREGTLQIDAFSCVKLGSIAVMRECGNRREEESKKPHQNAANLVFHGMSPNNRLDICHLLGRS